MIARVVVVTIVFMFISQSVDSIANGFFGSAKSASTIKSIAITGASGLVGTELTKQLQSKGINIITISTKEDLKSKNNIFWSPETSFISDITSLEGVDAIVHLAGENVASGEGPLSVLGRWSPVKKQKIYNSRVSSTKLLVDTMAKLKSKPKVFISASGVGFYGYSDSSTVFDESYKNRGEGFLAEVCDVWESESKKAEKIGIRTVSLRLAPIFSVRAGIIAKLFPIFNLGAGGIIGDGKQPFSWVTLNDVIRAIEFVLFDKSKLSGPVNVCSSNPVDNNEFTEAFGRAIGRPTILPVPEIAAKVVFGEMGKEMLLGGQKVIPKRLIREGFVFQDDEIKTALKKVLNN